jgi:hypothetical protein
MTRDAALAWIRAHERDSNEQAAQALLALIDDERVVRRSMISAFWSYLSNEAGYTTDFGALERLTEDERSMFDHALDVIVARRSTRTT